MKLKCVVLNMNHKTTAATNPENSEAKEKPFEQGDSAGSSDEAT